MKSTIKNFPNFYQRALARHLKKNAPHGLRPALNLGRQAVALGFDTLELARIHEKVSGIVMPSPPSASRSKKADFFFSIANSIIEETHHPARKGREHLGRLKIVLDKKTDELASTNRQLKRGVVRQKVMEEAAEKKGQHYRKCLRESIGLQNRLRLLTRRVLMTQEDERKKISHELHNEIAQTLLGINVRLLNLRQQAKANTKGLKAEIGSAQELVVKSCKSVRRVAREFSQA